MVKRLFCQLSAIYFERWNNRISPGSLDFVVNEWCTGLRGLTQIDIDYAIEKCRDPIGAFPTFPPTLPEFRKLCIRSVENKPKLYPENFVTHLLTIDERKRMMEFLPELRRSKTFIIDEMKENSQLMNGD